MTRRWFVRVVPAILIASLTVNGGLSRPAMGSGRSEVTSALSSTSTMLNVASRGSFSAKPGVHPDTQQPPATTIFYNGFSRNTLGSAWIRARGSNPNNDERECYSPQNVSVKSGVLIETASLATTCNAICPPTSTTRCPYQSGAVQWSNFSFTYGTVTVRAKLAGGTGPWAAIWLLGTDCQRPNWLLSSCDWPSPGSQEIDIAEVLGSDHTHVNEQIHVRDGQGAVEMPSCQPVVFDKSTNWHTYTLVWAPGSLTWMIDGVQTCQVTTGVPSSPMFMIIDTAVGGIGAGRVVGRTLPQSTEIQFVSVTQPAGG